MYLQQSEPLCKTKNIEKSLAQMAKVVAKAKL